MYDVFTLLVKMLAYMISSKEPEGLVLRLGSNEQLFSFFDKLQASTNPVFSSSVGFPPDITEEDGEMLVKFKMLGTTVTVVGGKAPVYAYMRPSPIPEPSDLGKHGDPMGIGPRIEKGSQK